MWETQEKPGKRFKAVKERLNELLEALYTSYCNMILTSENIVDIDQEIDAGKDGKVVVSMNSFLTVWFEFKNSKVMNIMFL